MFVRQRHLDRSDVLDLLECIFFSEIKRVLHTRRRDALIQIACKVSKDAILHQLPRFIVVDAWILAVFPRAIDDRAVEWENSLSTGSREIYETLPENTISSIWQRAISVGDEVNE